jgi:plasmid maintenance system antidote protein VapI
VSKEPRSAAWRPRWTVPPAETLTEWMADQHVTRPELAAWMGVKPAVVDDLLSSKVDTLTTAVALALERATSVPARMWLALEANYRQSPASRGGDTSAMLNTVIEKLVARRRELDMTQTDVATAMGVTQSAVAKIEGRSLSPRVPTLANYASVVGMTLSLDVSLNDPSGTAGATDTELGT